MGFQTVVNNQPAPAVAGDFAGANPRANLLAGAGALVAGLNGLIVGRFGWVSDVDLVSTTNSGAGVPDGFVAREQQGLITVFLAEASMVVPRGLPVTLYTQGDFWVKNDGNTVAQVGQTAYANLVNGQVSFGSSGLTASFADTTGSIAASTNGFTGSIVDDILTVTSVSSGTIVPGTLISGTGVASGTLVQSQLTGTAGGVGTYAVTPASQNVAAGTVMTGGYGTYTVSAWNNAVPVAVGAVLSGSGVTAGTTVMGFGTGTGGTGTYYVTPSQTAGSTNILATITVATKWKAASYAAVGELVKISSWN